MEHNQVTRVLWVEDDADDYVLMQSALNSIPHASYEFMWVSTYRDALAKLEQQAYDVCLLDNHLGADQGIDLIREAAAHGWETPFIVLTGQGTYELDLAAMEGGAVDFLDKSRISGAALDRAIRYAVERHKLQIALLDLSLRDELTHLYNRRGFMTLAEQHLRLARRQGYTALVMFADLDRLKWINDVYGHAAGSQAIINAANILRTTFRSADILARFGGDEFVVLVIDSNMSHVEAINTRLAESLAQFNMHPSYSFDLSMSFGYALFDPISDERLEQAVHAADHAMYEHKRAKKVMRTI